MHAEGVSGRAEAPRSFEIKMPSANSAASGTVPAVRHACKKFSEKNLLNIYNIDYNYSSKRMYKMKKAYARYACVLLALFAVLTYATCGNVGSSTSDDVAPPAVTLAVTGTPMSDTVTLTWTDPTEIDFSHILITWMPDSGTPQPIRVNAGIETAVVSDLDNQTYAFFATSWDYSGNQSLPSSAVNHTVNTADVTPPAPVTLAAAGADANGAVTLTWTDPTDSDFSHVLITWSPGSGGGGDQPLRVNAGVQTAVISNLSDQTYEFTAVAWDQSGNQSTVSNTANYTLNTPPAPITLAAAGSATSSTVTLTWTDPSDIDFSHVLIAWSPATGGGTQPLRVEAGVETAAISNLADLEYEFTAVAWDAAGQSSADNTVSYTVSAPPAPVTLAVTGTAMTSTVTLTWTDPSDIDFSHIIITWSPPSPNVTQPLRVEADVEMVEISNLADEEYEFTAVSWDESDNQSRASNTATHTINTVPAAVTDAAAISGNAGNVIITWTDSVSNDATHVGITNTTSSTAEILIPVGTQRAIISDLVQGTTYTFTLQVVDGGNLRSDTITVTGMPPGDGGKVAMFSLGRHDGGFGFAACQNFFDDTSNAISAELHSQGYTKAILFGSTPDYDYSNIGSDSDALMVSGVTVLISNTRGLSVYTEEAGVVTETTTFGSPSQAVTFATMSGALRTGVWPGASLAPDVLQVMGASASASYWTFTSGDVYDAANNCTDASSSANADIGVIGNTISVDGSTITTRSSVSTRTCDSEQIVLCIAH